MEEIESEKKIQQKQRQESRRHMRDNEYQHQLHINKTLTLMQKPFMYIYSSYNK